jgi:peptidoglycan/xylan/chitin deacetylase (PgdA/CDA1 family)
MRLQSILLGVAVLTLIVVLVISFFMSGFTGTPWAASGTCKQAGMVAFTFDDGVSNNYPYLLDVLDREEIKAGFFIVGNTLYSKKRRHLLAEAHNRGHMLLNHSWSHPDFTQISFPRLMREVIHTENLLAEASGGITYSFVRPPFGKINSKVYSRLKDMGFSIVLWNLDSRDWETQRSREELWAYYVGVFEKADPKKQSFLMLQHDRRIESIALIPDIARLARSKGFRVVSFAECFDIQTIRLN